MTPHDPMDWTPADPMDWTPQATIRHTPEQEAELVSRARQGDREARDALILSCYHLVFSVARKVARHGRPSDHPDLVQQGMIGLIRAVDSFDPARARLTTYAWRGIAMAMRAWLARNAATPVPVRDDEAIQTAECPRNGPIGETIETDIRVRAVRKAIASMPAQMALVANESLLGGRTYADVARDCGYSRERMRQVGNEVKAELRWRLRELS